MSLTVRQLITRKAALSRYRADDDPELLAVAAELRVARLLKVIEEQLSDDERTSLLTALGAGA
jgi:hypothetical protein